MNTQTTDHEMIPESKTARWAWRVSLIPLLGITLFIVLAFLALFQIGKGRTGFWLLRRGVIAVLLINGPYLGLYFSGYSGYYPNIHKAYWFLPNHGVCRIVISDPSNHELNEARQYWSYGRQEDKWTWIRRWDTGQKKEEGENIIDRREGKWTWWHDNGQTRKEGVYRNGREEGKWTWWHDNGQKREEGVYRNGREEGLWTSWYDDGQKKKEEEYILDNNFKYWQYVTWHRNGQKEEQGNGHDFKREGSWESWHPNGRKASEEHYLNGWPSDTWTMWNPKGDKREGGHGDVGGEAGLWTEIYANGQLKSAGVVNERQGNVGVWRYWDENGNTTQEKTYDNKGDLVKSIEYSRGNPVKEIEYQKGKPVKVTFYKGYSPGDEKK